MRNDVVGICLLGMALASIGWAYPTLTGPTGTGALPTADTAGPGIIQVAADYFITDSGNFPLRVVAGIGCPFEIGALYIAGERSIDSRTRIIGDPIVVDELQQEDLLGAHAKSQLPWQLFGGNLALGAQYYRGDLIASYLDNDVIRRRDAIGDLTATQAYLVLTRPFSACDEIAIIRGSLGVNWTRIEQNVDEAYLPTFSIFDGTDDALRVFLSVDVNVIDLVEVAVDVQSKAGDLETDALYSIVARYAFSPQVTGQIGFTNAAGVLGTSSTDLFVGAAYTFGGTP